MPEHASSSPLTIREATVADAPRLAELAGQLGYPSTAAQIEKRLRAIEAEGQHAVFVAEHSGGEVGGVLDVLVWNSVESESHAEIAALVVDEDSRHRGVGRRLVERAEEWTRAQGYDVVTLHSNVIRAHAHAFYERLGYGQMKTQKVFRKQL
jgi:GNAT superfamily N-acetyltransferase